MTSPKIPLFKEPSCIKLLEEKNVLPLLQTCMTISYRAPGGIKSVETTIGEVYRRCQQCLAAEFGSPKLLIKGSSVAKIFSREPAEDVDMHYVVDLTHLSERERIRKGYDLKWVVLRGIVQLIKEKLPAAEKGTTIRTEDILFTEKPYMLSTKTAVPFNVHGISFDGSPVELTLFSITKTVEQSQRGFDFNCGALELYLDPEGKNFLGSYTPDIDCTLSEIARRELTCSDPEEITRKGLSRYMAKLVISGYYDKDLSRFQTFLACEIEKHKDVDEVALGKKVLETIASHFKEKKFSPRALYLFLWLMKGDTPFIKILYKQAKEALLLELAEETSPKIRALLNLIATNKKAESAWFLLCQAKTIRKVVQRGEECLQIELPTAAIFSESQSIKSVFMTVPLQGLNMCAEISSAEGFSSLHTTENLIEVRGNDTKAFIQELLQETLTKPSMFPAFLIAMQKFSLKPDESFSLKFLAWFEALAEEDRLKIPLFALKNFLDSVPSDLILRQSTALSLFRLINRQKGEPFQYIAPKTTLTSIIFQLLKGDKFESLLSGDKELIKAYGKDLALAYLRETSQSIKGNEGEGKKIAGILYILYQKRAIDVSIALQGSESCLDLKSLPQAFKFLTAIVTNEVGLNQPAVLGYFLRLVRLHPLEFSKFAIANASLLKEKMSSFASIIDSLFYQLDEKFASIELSDLFVQLLDAYGSDDLKTIYKNETLRNATIENINYGALFTKMQEAWKLSSLDFISIDQMDATCLIFLEKQEDFKKRFGEDPIFTKAIALRALSAGLEELAIRGSSHLAQKHPDDALDVLKALLAGNHLSKKAFFQTLRILGEILEFSPDLAAKQPFKTVIEERLYILAIFISSTAVTSSTEIEEETLECIRYFHSKVLFDTLEHPCWKLLWKCIKEKKLPVGNWVDSKKMGERFSQIDPKGNIVFLVQTFGLDAPFLLEFVCGMKDLAPAEIDKYKSLLFFTFKMGRNSHDINRPKSDAKSHKAAQFLYELLDSFYTASEVPSAELAPFDIALLCLMFSALFGDQPLRAKIMTTMQSLLTNSGPVLQGFIKDSVHPKSVLFSCLDKALEEKNLKELTGLVQIYNSWGLDKDLSEKVIFSKTQVSTARCECFQKYLAELFKDPLQNERMRFNSQEFQLLGFYSLYLGELIVGQTVYETSPVLKALIDEQGRDFPINQEAVYTYFSNFLDFLTRKKLLGADPFFLQIFSAIMYQKNKERVAHFSHKYLLMATELLTAASKKPLDKEKAAPMFSLLEGIAVLQREAEKRGEVLFDPLLMLRFLKTARSTLLEYIDTPHQYLLCEENLPVLEGTLNREEAESYLHDWANSILARKETVSFQELNFFSFYSCQLDPRTYASGEMQRLLPRFRNKLFINPSYFSAVSVINKYIDIIDIGLSRYGHKILEPTPIPNDFSVFNLIPFYIHFLLRGINEQRNIADKENLQVSLILTMSKCLRLPEITTISAPAMMCLLNTLIGKRPTGGYELNKFPKAKLPLPAVLEIFHLVVKQLPRFSHKDFGIERAYFMILKHTYETGIAYKNKALSKDQIAEIECILSHPEVLKSPPASAEEAPAAPAEASGGEGVPTNHISLLAHSIVQSMNMFRRQRLPPS